MRETSKTRLVLVGGGHSHAVLLRDASPEELSLFEVILVSDVTKLIYSGMGPGLIAGLYSSSEVTIDVERLARARGVTFMNARAIGLDLKTGELRIQSVESRALENLGFDFLSLNPGAIGDLRAIEGAGDVAFPLKPLGRFVAELTKRLAAGDKDPVLVQVGGGAAGCECAAAMAARCQREKIPARVVIFEAGERLLPEAPVVVSRQMHRALKTLGVDVRLQSRVRAVSVEGVCFEKRPSGLTAQLESRFVALSLPGRAAPWLLESGLESTANGLLRINSQLQTSDPRIFAIGDVAQTEPIAWPHSGVYAIRAAQTLWKNLLAARDGAALSSFRPQRTWLSLLSDGQGRAMGYKGRWILPYSRATWWLKNAIDRHFIRSLQLDHRQMIDPS